MKVIKANHGALEELAGHEVIIEGIAYNAHPDKFVTLGGLPVSVVTSDAIIAMEDDGVYKSLTIIPFAQIARIKLKAKITPVPRG